MTVKFSDGEQPGSPSTVSWTSQVDATATANTRPASVVQAEAKGLRPQAAASASGLLALVVATTMPAGGARPGARTRRVHRSRGEAGQQGSRMSSPAGAGPVGWLSASRHRMRAQQTAAERVPPEQEGQLAGPPQGSPAEGCSLGMLAGYTPPSPAITTGSP